MLSSQRFWATEGTLVREERTLKIEAKLYLPAARITPPTQSLLIHCTQRPDSCSSKLPLDCYYWAIKSKKKTNIIFCQAVCGFLYILDFKYFQLKSTDTVSSFFEEIYVCICMCDCVCVCAGLGVTQEKRRDRERERARWGEGNVRKGKDIYPTTFSGWLILLRRWPFVLQTTLIRKCESTSHSKM